VAAERRIRPPPEVDANRAPFVIVLRDQAELFARSDLSDALVRLIASGTGDVVVDLAEADSIDTASFFTLAAAARLLDRNGRRLTFRSPSKLATRVLNLFGLSDRIDGEDRSL
jgi:anti-anti-sigma regulatory factor